MIRLTFVISIILLPFGVIGQENSEGRRNFNVEVYLDPYLGLTNKDFSKNTPGKLTFTYGGGINLNWEIVKRMNLRGGIAFHYDSYVNNVFAPCAALIYSCLPLRKVENRYLEIPVLVQYRINEDKSRFNTYISGGFINQILFQ